MIRRIVNSTHVVVFTRQMSPAEKVYNGSSVTDISSPCREFTAAEAGTLSSECLLNVSVCWQVDARGSD